MAGPGGRSAASVTGAAYTIGPATVAHVEALVELFATVVEEGMWLGAEPPADRAGQRTRVLERLDEGSAGASLVAVSDEDGAVIGQVGIDVAPYGVASLGMMVDPEWRGQGVGGALVEAAVDWCRRRGAHKVALQVWPHNHSARRLYLRHGFSEEGILRRHYRRRDGELWDAVVMGLVLDRTSPGSSVPA